MKASGITNSERKGLLVCTIIVSLVFFVIQTCSHRSDPRLSSTPLNAKDTFPVEIQESRAKLTGLARHPEASPASLFSFNGALRPCERYPSEINEAT